MLYRMKMRTFTYVFIILQLIISAATQAKNIHADMVLNQGKIYTLDKKHPWAQAIAVKEGKIIFIGKNDDAKNYIGKNTLIENLKGSMLMPGIIDAHSHPFQGGAGLTYKCDFSFTATPSEINNIIKQCLKNNPDILWLEGGQWTSDFFTLHDIKSPKKFLDNISTNVAIYLQDDSEHNAWVNSRALMLSNIDINTPDPKGGTIMKGKDGHPNGILLETASRIVASSIPEKSIDEYSRALLSAIDYYHSFGITAINEASTPDTVLKSYYKLDQEKRLSMHVTTNLRTPFGINDEPFNVQHLIKFAKKYRSEHVDTRFVKIFADGVPTAARTALMLENYTTDAEHPTLTKGMMHLDQAMLTKTLIELDKAGFTVKIHTAGDGSVHVALNAIEQVRKHNGESGLQFSLAHAGLIAPNDIDRFKTFNVIADFSPYIWFPSPIISSIRTAVGPRADHYWPTKDLLNHGVAILAGSDWPSAVETPNPWPAIEALISRKNPYQDQDEMLWPEQAISLSEALEIFTLKNASAMKLNKITGSLNIGKSADMILLNKNLFEIPVSEISEIQVQKTWFEGKLVYNRE